MVHEPLLTDSFGRHFPYLRLSITDVCNFRCSYCLPNGYHQTGREDFLTIHEIQRLVRAFTGLGVWKFRLTGGEPTIRPDFLDIVSAVAEVPGVRKLAFTTNGYKLRDRANFYYNAGLRAVNVSIDSLDPHQFARITGHERLPEILEGIDLCLKIGFHPVKINTVLLKNLNDAELDAFIKFVADKPISLRFIELMRTGENKTYFDQHHLPGHYIVERLLAGGWCLQERSGGAGPAQEFGHPKSLGTIGLIAPYSKDFCQTCNRLRISAKGALHLCLFGEGGYSLRHLLQADDQLEKLQQQILDLLQYKKSSHFLHQGITGTTPHLASIGG